MLWKRWAAEVDMKRGGGKGEEVDVEEGWRKWGRRWILKSRERKWGGRGCWRVVKEKGE